MRKGFIISVLGGVIFVLGYDYIEASICDNPEFIRKHLGTSCSGIYTEKWTPEQFGTLK